MSQTESRPAAAETDSPSANDRVDISTLDANPVVGNPFGSAPFDGLQRAESNDTTGLNGGGRLWRAIGLPNLGVSIAWTGTILMTQLAVGLVIGIGGAVIMISRLGRIDAQQLNAILIPILVPVGTMTTLLVALAASLLVFRSEIWRRLGFHAISWAQLLLIVLAVLPLQILASEVSNWMSEGIQVAGQALVDRGVISESQQQAIFESRMSGGVFEKFAVLPWPLVFVALCILPGVGEEIFFRGFLSRGLIAKHGVWLGSLFAAALFGAVHVDPVQAAGAFALGLALQYVFLTTRSLTAPIIVHTLNNSVAFLMMRYGEAFPVPGFTQTSADVSSVPHTPPGILLMSAGVVLLLFWLLYRCRTTWVTRDGRDWNPGFPSAESPPVALAAYASRQPLNPMGLMEMAMAFTYGLLFCGLYAASRGF